MQITRGTIKSNMNTKIIVCYHKQFKEFANEVLLPLHVGAQNSSNSIANMQRDDTGINISEKNNSYCELTGLYWLWKNINADNYGLFHYRRFLDIKNKYKDSIYPSIINTDDWSKKDFDSLMQKYDIILPKKNKFKINIYERYKKEHHAKDLDLVVNTIKALYPEYSEIIEKSLSKKEEYSCNMFVMKKDIFIEYCQWLFSALNEVESKINIADYNSYQSRVFGFLSERMLNFFIDYKLKTCQNLKILHVPQIMINDEPICKKDFLFAKFINYPTKYYFNILGINCTINKKAKKWKIL